MDQGRFQDAISRFDAANAQDPTQRELPYAIQLSQWVERLAPHASEELRLAARCQHLCRWMIPRSDYPMDRIGYLKWREALKHFHAARAGEILQAIGYPQPMIERVQQLNLKKLWPKDPEARVLEDALCLQFLATQFEELAAKTPADKMIGIIQKTWKKMSPEAREFALTLPMNESQRTLIQRALES